MDKLEKKVVSLKEEELRLLEEIGTYLLSTVKEGSSSKISKLFAKIEKQNQQISKLTEKRDHISNWIEELTKVEANIREVNEQRAKSIEEGGTALYRSAGEILSSLWEEEAPVDTFSPYANEIKELLKSQSKAVKKLSKLEDKASWLKGARKLMKRGEIFYFRKALRLTESKLSRKYEAIGELLLNSEENRELTEREEFQTIAKEIERFKKEQSGYASQKERLLKKESKIKESIEKFLSESDTQETLDQLEEEIEILSGERDILVGDMTTLYLKEKKGLPPETPQKVTDSAKALVKVQKELSEAEIEEQKIKVKGTIVELKSDLKKLKAKQSALLKEMESKREEAEKVETVVKEKEEELVEREREKKKLEGKS